MGQCTLQCVHEDGRYTGKGKTEMQGQIIRNMEQQYAAGKALPFLVCMLLQFTYLNRLLIILNHVQQKG